MRLRSMLHPRAFCGALAAAALLGGMPAASFADEPAKPTTAAAPEKKAETTESAAARGGLTEVDIARAFKKYRKTVRDGNTVYCRNEKPVGTRIGKQVCYTEEQVVMQARLERDQQDNLSNVNICGRGSCSPGG